jgi:hypothetical protein
MGDHRKWARGTQQNSRVPVASRYPEILEPTRALLEDMAGDPSLVFSAGDIFSYLSAPEDDGGAGLVPGETMPHAPTFKRWVLRGPLSDLWLSRAYASRHE